MTSMYAALEELTKSMNIDQLILVKYLPSFHSVGRTVYQRPDNKKYIYVEFESSNSDTVDDYFRWMYIDSKNLPKYGLVSSDEETS